MRNILRYYVAGIFNNNQFSASSITNELLVFLDLDHLRVKLLDESKSSILAADQVIICVEKHQLGLVLQLLIDLLI